MQREITFDTIESFVDTCKSAGIERIACAEINERRPIQIDAQVLQVVPVRRLDLIAYRDSAVYKCRLVDVDHDAVCGRLEATGFIIKRTNKNIT